MEGNSDIAYDPGLGKTALCKSSITYLDGENGVLRYRGYPIEEVAGGSRSLGFDETALLISEGEVPTDARLSAFRETIGAAVAAADREKIGRLAEIMIDKHPMEFLHAAVLTIDGVEGDASEESYREALPTIMALLPLMHADFMRLRAGQETAEWDTSLGYSERFYKARFNAEDKSMSGILDLLLVLHADHEQNCSTTTARTVASSKAGIRHVVAAAVGALAGPLHGGANEEVVRQLEEMQQSGLGPAELMEQVVKGERRLMGFGHRVYKNFDPRATIIKKAAEDVAAKTAGGDELLSMAMHLEKEALENEYFILRKLYPNVDFYSGLIYRGMGFSTDEYTSLFAIGRTPGWVSQSVEQVSDGEQRIVRPQQIYTGEGLRKL